MLADEAETPESVENPEESDAVGGCGHFDELTKEYLLTVGRRCAHAHILPYDFAP